jgi:pyruvate formate lyase activating enzyme
VEEATAIVMQDEVFYRHTGGGLTVSGGEPLVQIDFTRALLAAVSAQGVHTAIETAGNVPSEYFERVTPFTDLFLYDVKLMDSQKHREWTGEGNEQILDNLRRLVRQGKEIIIRVPLIPAVNDEREFEAIADFVHSLPGVRELHILPFHHLGSSKYVQLGMIDPMDGKQEANAETVARARTYAEGLGLRVSVGGSGF